MYVPKSGTIFILYYCQLFCFDGEMERVLDADTERIRMMAFRQQKRCSRLLAKFHKLKDRINENEEHSGLWNVYDWLLVPFSLWPIDFEGLATYILACLQQRKVIDNQLKMLLRTIEEPRLRHAYSDIERFEGSIHSGKYETLIRQPAKFAEMEMSIEANTDFHQSWRDIKSCFKVAAFRNKQGVIRRRLAQERNFRPDWEFKWTDDKQKFRVLFDALCHRWHLYGVEQDKPLLMKISVNPTAYGTMIVIPGHWSFDNKRDLDWSAIRRLHKVHGASKQGPKLSLGRIERLQEARKVKKHWEKAGKLGLKGEERLGYVFEKTGKNSSCDPSFVKRALRLAKGTPPRST